MKILLFFPQAGLPFENFQSCISHDTAEEANALLRALMGLLLLTRGYKSEFPSRCWDIE